MSCRSRGGTTGERRPPHAPVQREPARGCRRISARRAALRRSEAALTRSRASDALSPGHRARARRNDNGGVQFCAGCALEAEFADNQLEHAARAGTKRYIMAARPTWKGFLKISLVNIPVRVFPATDSAATISFNQLHGECQTRIQQKRWCPKCDREIPLAEIVKGYEFEKGRYVVMDEEDLSKVRPESTRVIDLVQFTPVESIDPIYVERPYYLAPDGQMALESFAVIREGMKGKAGIGKLALYGREYLVAVQPKDKGLVMYTMRRANEVRSMDAIDELAGVPSKVKPEEIKMAKQVISNFEGELNLAEYNDAYQEELQRIIDAKIAGEEVVATEEQTPPKVVNLMDALRQSLDRVSTGKKKTVKVEADAPAKVKAAPAKKRARG